MALNHRFTKPDQDIQKHVTKAKTSSSLMSTVPELWGEKKKNQKITQ
jgi:hypothetical protein